MKERNKYASALIAALLLSSAAMHAQEFELDPEAVKDIANWAAVNIPADALDALGVDKDRVHQFLTEVQKRMHGTEVYDLGGLRETARQIEPLLATFEETQPYALWLRTRLADFEVSQQLRKDALSASPNKSVLVPPSAETQRRAWVKVIEERRVPAAATNKQIVRLKQVLSEERVPPQLVWIAEVESSFDARARSPVGAAGLFQLMPATARSLNMSVGLFRDDRLDPEKSARAAARYLRYLHSRFNDWRLALAAYNCGEGRVSALLKKHKAKAYDDINEYLPVETQMYVPKIEATLRKREKMNLKDLRQPKA